MITYFDKCIYLYGYISGIKYEYKKFDSTEWEDLYDGLSWENPDIQKPTKSELDALDDEIVEIELKRRAEVERKKLRNEKYKNDLILKASYSDYKKSNPKATFSDFLDFLEIFDIN